MLRLGQAGTMVTVVAVCLGIGFFSGREYMKYEIRTKLAEAFQGFGQLATAAQPIGPAAATPAPIKPTMPEQRSAPVEVIMSEKGWMPSNPHGGEFDDLVTFKLLVKNVSGRKVRAFDGVLYVTDLLGNSIINLNVAINDPVASTAPLTWPGTMRYNQFIETHQALRNADFANIKTKFQLHKILFDDGQVQTF